MSRARKLAVYALIAVVGLGSLACIVAGRDCWPLLHYPMYAELVHGRRELFWLYGRTRDGEIPLHGLRYWHPLDEQRLGLGISRLSGEGADARAARDALRKLAERYEAARRAGRHAAPALEGLAVYSVTWDVRSGGPVGREPDRRTLIAEERFDGGR